MKLIHLIGGKKMKNAKRNSSKIRKEGKIMVVCSSLLCLSDAIS